VFRQEGLCPVRVRPFSSYHPSLLISILAPLFSQLFSPVFSRHGRKSGVAAVLQSPPPRFRRTLSSFPRSSPLPLFRRLFYPADALAPPPGVDLWSQGRLPHRGAVPFPLSAPPPFRVFLTCRFAATVPRHPTFFLLAPPPLFSPSSTFSNFCSAPYPPHIFFGPRNFFFPRVVILAVLLSLRRALVFSFGLAGSLLMRGASLFQERTSCPISFPRCLLFPLSGPIQSPRKVRAGSFFVPRDRLTLKDSVFLPFSPSWRVVSGARAFLVCLLLPRLAGFHPSLAPPGRLCPFFFFFGKRVEGDVRFSFISPTSFSPSQPLFRPRCGCLPPSLPID